MVRKNKALAVAVLLVVLVGPLVACSSQLGGKSDPRVVKAEDGGEEEVLSEDDADRDEFGRPKAEGAQGVFVSLTYLTMSIGAALLPFLMLL
jgi:hypothetical protein